MPGRRTYRAGAIGIRKTIADLGKIIQVGCLHLHLACPPHGPGAHLVTYDKYDVGLFAYQLATRYRQDAGNDQKYNTPSHAIQYLSWY
jgi:hypothetical protein